MLAALLSSGSNMLGDNVSSGHALLTEISHIASGLGDSVSQSVSTHLSVLTPLARHASGQPRLSRQQLSAPKHASSLASDGSQDGLAKRLVCSISFAPGPKVPGMG